MQKNGLSAVILGHYNRFRDKNRICGVKKNCIIKCFILHLPKNKGKMERTNHNIPAYIYEKGNIVRLILLTAFFALIFINIYKPFGSFTWYKVSDFKFLVFSSLIILTGVLVVVISRIIMYYYGKKHTISYSHYAIWILLEILFMSLFYTIYTLYLNPTREYLTAFKESTMNTSLVLLLPYAGLHLYFSYKEKERQLALIASVREEEASKAIVYSFYDEKNEFRISIKRTNLLYLESADNYVLIWYLNKGSLTKFLLRNTLKKIEEQMGESNVLRCHRSFMVNFDQVKVLRREKEGIYIEFDIEGVPDIPISKTYVDKVSKWVMAFSQ